MNIRIVNGQISFGGLWKLFFAGVFGFYGSFFLLILALMTVIFGISDFSGVGMTASDGQNLTLATILPMWIIAPIILTLNSALFAFFFAIGVWIFKRFRPIEIQIEGELPMVSQ